MSTQGEEFLRLLDIDPELAAKYVAQIYADRDAAAKQAELSAAEELVLLKDQVAWQANKARDEQRNRKTNMVILVVFAVFVLWGLFGSHSGCAPWEVCI